MNIYKKKKNLKKKKIPEYTIKNKNICINKRYKVKIRKKLKVIQYYIYDN